ncbi:hypothetical protein D8Y22_13075 [Salinadaptatus halalkaliphilus]|uniref:DUF8159 domain-containing protein n=1 Tax=Salinadaptatus halalkaliphilus TaxID=2419781 RepID=A0A4S3TJU3_9EURY|nr:hypothetical protein [Salinadaptatus halalkaliphilus]THE64342.1 hypothetical protein D8Y22_13075 [Salinadaptatus halalkaliphilus]
MAPDRPTRRQALAAAGTVSVGSMAGCLDSLPFLDNTRVEVEPEEPDDDDPDASPEEFYYILEDNGITVDELYYDTEDDDIILFYESDAEDQQESDEEVWLIYVLFRDGLVDRETDANHLYTEVLGGFDGQVEGWGANSEWAEDHLEGTVTDLTVWNGIVDTMVYPDDESRYDHGNETDSDIVLGEESADGSPTGSTNSTTEETDD